MIEQEDERLDGCMQQRLDGGSPPTEPPRPALSPEQQHVIVHMHECGHRVETIASYLGLQAEDVQQAIERGYPR